MVWNRNGLQIKFDVEQADMVNSGMYCSNENRIVYEVDVDLAELEAGTPFIVSYGLKVKQGSTLISGELVPSETAAGGTSVDIGLYDTEGETAVDADGFYAAIATASLTKGNTVAANGALLETDMTDDGVIAVTTTGTFTAGKVKARLVFEVL